MDTAPLIRVSRGGACPSSIRIRSIRRTGGRHKEVVAGEDRPTWRECLLRGTCRRGCIRIPGTSRRIPCRMHRPIITTMAIPREGVVTVEDRDRVKYRGVTTTMKIRGMEVVGEVVEDIHSTGTIKTDTAYTRVARLVSRKKHISCRASCV